MRLQPVTRRVPSFTSPRWVFADAADDGTAAGPRRDRSLDVRR